MVSYSHWMILYWYRLRRLFWKVCFFFFFFFSSFFDNCCCAFALLFGSFHTAAHVGLLLKAKRNLLDVVVSPDACVGDVAGPNIDPAPERKTSRRPRVIRSGRQSIMQDPMHTHTHTYIQHHIPLLLRKTSTPM